MDHVSVVGKNADHHDQIAGVEMSNRATGNKADEGAKGGAAGGAALGGLGGLLVGLGALAIPGIGPVIAGGALATALATTAAGGAIGAAAGGIAGALVGLGIPEERARFYNDRVNRGDYLVMVDGTEDEIRRAEPILRRHGIQEWGIYDASDVTAGRSGDVKRDRDYDRAHPESAAPGYAAAAVATPRTGTGRRHRAIGVFPHRRDAEAALTELRASGFNMDHVSVVGKNADHHDQIAGVEMSDRTKGNKADEGAKGGAAGGAALGGLGGLLVGLGALAIPGIGPVIAGGALSTALATAAAGGAIGAAAGGIGGALVGLGIPEERARFYNDRVNRGDYLVMVDGTEDEIRRAEAILSRHGIQEWGIYDASDVTAGRSGDVSRDRDYDRAHPESTVSDRSRVDTTTTATRNIIDPHPTTPNLDPAHRDYKQVSSEPEVIIIDHRDQTP
jgi:predicted nucleic acid-binding protein